jgi:hypothetical protein
MATEPRTAVERPLDLDLARRIQPGLVVTWIR